MGQFEFLNPFFRNPGIENLKGLQIPELLKGINIADFCIVKFQDLQLWKELKDFQALYRGT